MKRTLLLLLTTLMAIAVVAVGGEGEVVAQTTVPEKLYWEAPPLENPITISVPANDTSYGNGLTRLRLDTTKDYIIDLPDKRKVGGLHINGGRNVVVMGGYISANPDKVIVNSDTSNASISISGNQSVIHIEGVLIDGSAGGQSDGIRVSNSPDGIVQLQNMRVVELFGDPPQEVHSDVVQLVAPDGVRAVKELRIDRFTGSSTITGFNMDEHGPTHLKNVNLFTHVKKGYRTSTWARVVKFNGPGSCVAGGHTLESVYGIPPAKSTLGERVNPTTKYPNECAALQESNPTRVSWPKLPISGYVYLGPPPGGDFVPAGVAGVGYTSPGYAAR